MISLKYADGLKKLIPKSGIEYRDFFKLLGLEKIRAKNIEETIEYLFESGQIGIVETSLIKVMSYREHNEFCDLPFLSQEYWFSLSYTKREVSEVERKEIEFCNQITAQLMYPNGCGRPKHSKG